MTEALSLEDLEALAGDCLTRAGVSRARALTVARDTVAAEARGDRANGLDALLRDLRLIRYGRLHASARPEIATAKAAVLQVDAGHGFAAVAVDAALPGLIDMARQKGLAVLRLDRASDPAGLFGALVTLADAGLVALTITGKGAARMASPDHPMPRPLLTPARPALAALLGVVEDEDDPADSPLGAPVAHRGWILAADPLCTGLMELVGGLPTDSLEPPARRVALPTDLLAQIVTS
ncbi:Ldh family oxidoreductase [Maritalea mobilis]|uniref:Ldh family oxidoreductase n=1 Tax=Maritalea mobilis TaxID=483324 RepID=UPI001C987A01|nr:Ldh family oxidoreductase [Maritalea mobilis]MBY6202720.1 Ldh family oxidoreductase [Maritalea mobilis]